MLLSWVIITHVREGGEEGGGRRKGGGSIHAQLAHVDVAPLSPCNVAMYYCPHPIHGRYVDTRHPLMFKLSSQRFSASAFVVTAMA